MDCSFRLLQGVEFDGTLFFDICTVGNPGVVHYIKVSYNDDICGG